MNAIDQPSLEAAPRRPTMDRAQAVQLAEREYARVLDVLRSLTAEDWGRPTECAAWDVRAMAGHVTGMALMASSLRETVRQTVVSLRRGGVPVDALTALQVEEHAGLSPGELVERFATLGPRAARGRRRTPAVVRRRRLPVRQEVGGRSEPWTVGFLNDTILTRDPWMHRMDICRATGREPVLTPEHDGSLVADVVEEWADRHGRPFALHLTGPAGGDFARGDGGAELTLDAVDFCRVLSGRSAGRTGGPDHPPEHDLLDVAVPF